MMLPLTAASLLRQQASHRGSVAPVLCNPQRFWHGDNNSDHDPGRHPKQLPTPSPRCCLSVSGLCASGGGCGACGGAARVCGVHTSTRGFIRWLHCFHRFLFLRQLPTGEVLGRCICGDATRLAPPQTIKPRSCGCACKLISVQCWGLYTVGWAARRHAHITCGRCQHSHALQRPRIPPTPTPCLPTHTPSLPWVPCPPVPTPPYTASSSLSARVEAAVAPWHCAASSVAG
jgi:hypothetical protein